jgi:hypothetical protein
MALAYLKDGRWDQALKVSQLSNDRFVNRSSVGYPIYIIKNYDLEYFAYMRLGKASEGEKVRANELPEMECFESIDDVYQRIENTIKTYVGQLAK